MKIFGTSIRVPTQGQTDVVDVTAEIHRLIVKYKIANGQALLFVNGSTAGLTTLEFEPGVVKDLKEAFERWASRKISYAHHDRWGDDNGHAHVRAALLGPSLAVPIQNGQMTLGTWQQIVLVDFDTRARDRSIIVQLLGEEGK